MLYTQKTMTRSLSGQTQGQANFPFSSSVLGLLTGTFLTSVMRVFTRCIGIRQRSCLLSRAP